MKKKNCFWYILRMFNMTVISTLVGKSNKNITFQKDDVKSYVYIYDGSKQIGTLMREYKKKKWIFEKV